MQWFFISINVDDILKLVIAASPLGLIIDDVFISIYQIDFDFIGRYYDSFILVRDAVNSIMVSPFPVCFV